jgi:hypothetical protein
VKHNFEKHHQKIPFDQNKSILWPFPCVDFSSFYNRFSKNEFFNSLLACCHHLIYEKQRRTSTIAVLGFPSSAGADRAALQSTLIGSNLLGWQQWVGKYYPRIVLWSTKQ